MLTLEQHASITGLETWGSRLSAAQYSHPPLPPVTVSPCCPILTQCLSISIFSLGYILFYHCLFSISLPHPLSLSSSPSLSLFLTPSLSLSLAHLCSLILPPLSVSLSVSLFLSLYLSLSCTIYFSSNSFLPPSHLTYVPTRGRWSCLCKFHTDVTPIHSSATYILCVCVCMPVSMSVCVCVCVRILHVCICVCVCMPVSMSVCARVSACECVCAYVCRLSNNKTVGTCI